MLRAAGRVRVLVRIRLLLTPCLCSSSRVAARRAWASSASSALPVQPISQDVLAEKYLKDGEKTAAGAGGRPAPPRAAGGEPGVR